MIRDYQIVSPSLEGVLRHDTLKYEHIRRPAEVLRILDGPASKGTSGIHSDEERNVLEDYFQDLYGVFMKKLSFFVVEAISGPDTAVKLQALLQEMIKVKQLLGKGKEEEKWLS